MRFLPYRPFVLLKFPGIEILRLLRLLRLRPVVIGFFGDARRSACVSSVSRSVSVKGDCYLRGRLRFV
jgi:hypothetical protein